MAIWSYHNTDFFSSFSHQWWASPYFVAEDHEIINTVGTDHKTKYCRFDKIIRSRFNNSVQNHIPLQWPLVLQLSSKGKHTNAASELKLQPLGEILQRHTPTPKLPSYLYSSSDEFGTTSEDSCPLDITQAVEKTKTKISRMSYTDIKHYIYFWYQKGAQLV
jgi:hypothetical protein